ncbi:MAG: threonylcarbamoyl-AMP synthase [Caldilineaceae bacterium]|nr:threonylcarbamoyl-AMP synthase [Caldilineaceae bacterium]
MNPYAAGGRDEPAAATQVLPLDDPAAQTLALALLAGEQIVVAPTDTVYGVMCRYDSPAAIARLYVAKDRPPQKAIPVLIGDPAQLDALVQMPLPPAAHALIGALWPGALTLVLAAQPHLPAVLTAGQPTVAVRMPDHAGLRALIRRSGPLAATSANRSGGPDTRSAAEALGQLAGRVPLILADPAPPPGAPPATQPSTIVDLAGSARPRLLRAGALDDAVRAALAAAGLRLDTPPHVDRR